MRMTALLASAALLSAALATNAYANDVYKVDLNKTKIVRLPVDAASVVIGNPDIADVTVQSVRTLFVVGRGFGETNLIILDANGDTVMDADIQVIHTMPLHSVRVHNGASKETYSCLPACQPAPILGDDMAFIGNNTAPKPPTNPFTALFESLTEETESETMAGDGPVPGPTGNGIN